MKSTLEYIRVAHNKTAPGSVTCRFLVPPDKVTIFFNACNNGSLYPQVETNELSFCLVYFLIRRLHDVLSAICQVSTPLTFNELTHRNNITNAMMMASTKPTTAASDKTE
jgi:hypothetical protein